MCYINNGDDNSMNDRQKNFFPEDDSEEEIKRKLRRKLSGQIVDKFFFGMSMVGKVTPLANNRLYGIERIKNISYGNQGKYTLLDIYKPRVAAKKYPQKINSLLLHEPVTWGVIYDSKQKELQRSFDQLCLDLFSEGENVDPDSWLQIFVGYWNTPKTWENLPEKTKALWRSRFPKVYAEVSSLCLDRTPLSHWASLHHRTCITLSNDSPAHEKEVCSLLASTLSNATLIRHKGGHLAPLSHFSELSSIVKSWLPSV